MLKPLPDEPPRFYGARVFNDAKQRFSFWVATNWQQLELDEHREGAMFVPDPEDLDTHISVWVSGLSHRIRANDMPDLRRGLEEGLAQLPDCEVESRSDDTYDNLIKFERVITYGPGDPALRSKRKSWYLYVDTWSIVLAWQGSTIERYEYWLPMGNYAFGTFNVAEWLWFATDRELGSRL